MLEKIANSFLLVFILLAFTTPFWKPLYQPGGDSIDKASSKNNDFCYCENLTILDSDENLGYQISVETKDVNKVKVWVPTELYKKIFKDFHSDVSINNFIEIDRNINRERKYLYLRYIKQNEINIVYDYSI